MKTATVNCRNEWQSENSQSHKQTARRRKRTQQNADKHKTSIRQSLLLFLSAHINDCSLEMSASERDRQTAAREQKPLFKNNYLQIRE
jgi:hypothetical protein